MDIIREFQTYYDNGYKEALPRKFTEDYEIMECLSNSEDCDTLLVKQRLSGRKLVAKCYGRSSLRYDMEEPAQLKSMENKAIPQYIGEYKNEEYRCVLREYIEGISLDEYVRTNSLTEDIVAGLAIGLASAMKVLHDAHPAIIHRDIKPENIIVKEDGSIALIDLGISRIFKKDGAADTFFSGTEGFAPPEQYGFMQTDIRSDIYSFGIVLSWLLTGRAEQIKFPHTRLERVAARCCAFAPDRRYENTRALLRDLYRTTVSHRQRMRKRVCVSAVFLLLSAVGLSVVGSLYQRSLRDKEIMFREPLIEEAVRAVLDRPEGVITAEDLENVTGIYIQAQQVYTTMDDWYILGGEWYHGGERIRGPITELSDLEKMPNLRTVFIGGNHIQNLSPLQKLESLVNLDLRDNDVQDIYPLTDKKTLEIAGFMGNPLTGIEAVSTWPMLKELNLDWTGSYDAEPIGKLKNLQVLCINNDSDAWRYLDGLYVHDLTIKAAGQTDLECLRNVAYIEKLYLQDAQIWDISALKGREDIVSLSLEQCVMGDLTPLFTMPNLGTVEMSVKGQEQMEELISVHGQPSFEIIYT